LLPEGAQQVLSLLSVSRAALTSETLQGAVHRLNARGLEVAAELETLIREHLVFARVVSGTPVYRFVRDDERVAFEATLEAEHRAALAKAMGLELESSGETAAAANLLLDACPDLDAGRLALAAGEELLARGAHDEATGLFRRALPLLPPSTARRAHQQLSELYAFKGDLKASLRHLLRSREGTDPELRVGVAKLLLRLGRVGWAEWLLTPLTTPASMLRPDVAALLVEIALIRGRAELAIVTATAQLPRLAHATKEQAFALLSVLGKAYLQRGKLDEAQVAYEQAHALALDHGKIALASEALINLGVVLHRRGDREGAARCYREGLPNASRFGQAQALANLGSVYTESGDFELAREHLARALRWFAWIGGSSKVAHTGCNLARLNHFLGDLERAEALAADALSFARGSGEPYIEASALLIQGEVLVDRREYAQAQALLEQARVLFDSIGHGDHAAFASAVKARAHLKLGERAEAAHELSRPTVRQEETARVEIELAKGELALAQGDLVEAGRASARAREALLSRPELEGPSRVHYLAGRLKLAAGDVTAQAELAKGARALEALAQKVPQALRQQFLSVPHRSQVLSAVESELRAPLRPPTTEGPVAPFGLVGVSKSLKDVIRQIAPIARTQTTVLVRGESGTGKELVAQAIHDTSSRHTFPIVKVNCAAMVSDLLLSELFGHEKGAFTGAVRERKGRFELADGGTIFLDEIGDIDPQCQIALLRVLQEREFERVGGTKTIKVDVRVICATNKDLEALIAQGKFRQDLYYRLKGVMLELPPLRERLEDLPLLSSHVLVRAAVERSEPEKQLSPAALQLLARHSWPGNIRELENVLASAAIFARGRVIAPEDFAHVPELAVLHHESRRSESSVKGTASTAASAPAVDYYALVRSSELSLRELQERVEQQCYRRALLDSRGSITEAAKLLKMKRSRLSQIVNGDPELRRIADGD
ncbi:MAG: sigma 54-interacting transcriptional regulator, partial [Myxococcaceae bacterium]